MTCNTKKESLNYVLKCVTGNIKSLESSAKEAHLNSVGEESKQESKYDTRGLEASYLAEAQLRKLQELQKDILLLSQTQIKEDSDSVEVGSMFALSSDTEERYYFLLLAGGGIEFDYQGYNCTVVTPFSAIGRQLLEAESLTGLKIEGESGKSFFLVDFW